MDYTLVFFGARPSALVFTQEMCEVPDTGLLAAGSCVEQPDLLGTEVRQRASRPDDEPQVVALLAEDEGFEEPLAIGIVYPCQDIRFYVLAQAVSPDAQAVVEF